MTTATSAPIPATDPFTSLAVHFGMLLGVTDLNAVVGHAWAKQRLHNAWLHGEGVVWGGGVTVEADSREVRVEPFLALDALGRELYLPILSCVDAQAWYEANKDRVSDRGEGGEHIFDVVVVAAFRACLAKPVPALISPCEGATAESAYSRLVETAELFLLPADAADVPARVDRYPRLRHVLGLPSTVDDTERTALNRELRETTDVARLVRDVVARDVIARHPSTAPGDAPLFDGSEPAYVVLARIAGLTLSAGQPVTASADRIDTGVRVSHVDTATLVDLAARTTADAGGPRVRPDTAARAGDTVTVDVTGPVREPTLAGAVSVRRLDDAAGWVPVAVGPPTFAGSTITIPLTTAGIAATERLRVLIAGTGPTPVVGDVAGQPVPLAGVVGGPPAGREEGHDAVFTIGGPAT
jgi:hypothetical protein